MVFSPAASTFDVPLARGASAPFRASAERRCCGVLAIVTRDQNEGHCKWAMTAIMTRAIARLAQRACLRGGSCSVSPRANRAQRA